MEVHFAPDLEKKLKDLAAQSGRGADEFVQDVVAGYVDDLAGIRAHIEEGFLQAERGELIDGVQARTEIQASKDAWLRERSPKG
jgi:predicted transcriptional regulator